MRSVEKATGRQKSESAINEQKMIDFGNVLRHAYRAIKVEIVWDVVQNDLPVLKSFAVRNIEHG